MPKLCFFDSFVNYAMFFFSCWLLNMDFPFALIVHIQGNQLVPELLLNHSDTLHNQLRYIEHVHEEVSCQKQ